MTRPPRRPTSRAFSKSPTNPISLARAGYWLGRTAEAANRPQEARAHYQSAAGWSTAYYGQLARAKLGARRDGRGGAAVTPFQRASVGRLELVRALDILYALGERSLVIPLMADLGDKIDDVGALAALGDRAEQNATPRHVAPRQGGARARLPSANTPSRPSACPIYADRAGRRTGACLFHHSPGERFQSRPTSRAPMRSG